MAGTLLFDTIPGLQDNWWDGTDADTVWPIWKQYRSYFWGANSGNQFLARGVNLMGAGLAGSHGPTKGRAHPQYVGVDTMSSSKQSLTNNNKVYAQMKAYLEAGHTLIVPIDLRHSLIDREKAKFSLGTGIGLSQSDAAVIHHRIWGAVITLIGTADNVKYNSKMWSPDMSLPIGARAGSRVDLANLTLIKAYHAKLAAASAAYLGT